MNRLVPLLLLAVLFTVTGCASQAPTPTAAPIEPVKGRADTRDYRYLQLDNGLQVLLVSDPEADKAAASLSVAAGTLAEPEEWPGLAHFLEHMLFLGTEKYPEPDAYHEFMARNGGGDNAYTALDHTNYFFSVAADVYPEALDRFAQFFIAPLMTPDYVDKEVNAVEQEYQLQLRQDSWRGFMVQKQAFNPAHPASRFSIGSTRTLTGEGILAALDAFYERWYVADQMALVAVAPVSLDMLESLVRERFTAVRGGDAERFHTSQPLYTRLPRRLDYLPIRSAHTLSFNFPLPPQAPHYRAGVMRYLGNLLGHEGEGSLHALLKGRGWITSLSAGGGDVGADDAEFTVSMELTEAGVENRAAIEQAFFAYLDLVRSSGVSESLYREQAQLAQLAFEFQEQLPEASWARVLSPALLTYPPADVLRHGFAMDAFDPARIRDVLAQMTPERVLVMFGSPTVTTDRTERWFGVEYALTDIPPQTIEAWRSAPLPAGLSIPAPNPFVPEDLTLESNADATVPERIIDTDGLEFWLLRDASFGVPRAQLKVRLDTAHAMTGPRDAVLGELYVELVRDALNAYAYPAALAGLGYSLASDGTGLTIALSGYDDKQDRLLGAVLDTLTGVELRPARFELFRAELRRQLDNQARNRPYEQMASIARTTLLDPAFTPPELAAELADLTLGELEQFRAALLSGLSARVLLTGNVSRADAQQLAGTLRQHLPLRAGLERVRPALADLRGDEPGLLRREWPVEHDDASFTWYVQGRNASLRERALFGLLGQMYRPAYFDDLRTERGLGYVVSAHAYPIEDVPGMRFYVQSSNAGVPDLLSLTREFVQRFDAEVLPEMPAATFEEYRQGLITRLRERDKNPGERSSRLWSDLVDDQLDFDTRERIARELEALTPADLRDFHAEFMALMNRQGLIVHTWGKFGPGEVPGTPINAATALPAFPRG